MENFPTLEQKNYQSIRSEIRSGDLLLCSGSSIFSTLIQRATRSIWSHVAFILCLEPIDRVMVLESVESVGVRTIPLSNYVRDYNGTGKGYPGRIMLARHHDVKEKNIPKLSKRAIDLLGYPYRQDEIIHIAARISMHSLGAHDMPPDCEKQRAFICSEYAYTCFKSIGVTIDYNRMGFIAPADFARHPKVKPMVYIQEEVSVPSEFLETELVANKLSG